MLTRTFFLALLATGLSMLPVTSQTPLIDVENPNILILLADDLGYADLSCYGSAHISTPVLDSIAEKGIRFTDFYAGSVVCSPSRAALLTGRNHNRTGVYTWIPENSPMHLPVNEITIAEILKKTGYQTVHIGKWHLGQWKQDSNEHAGHTIHPSINEYGFDYWYACANNALPSHKNPYNFYLNGTPLGEQQGYSCQLAADQAITWLEKQRKPDEPFYMQIWFNEPHEIVAAPETFRKRHLDKGLTEHQADYYGCIENMDQAIGRVLRKLNDLGISRETLVIFTSDNGSRFPGSNGILKGKKGQVWEGGIRVPSIFYWKDTFVPDWNQDAPCGIIDLFPTLCELINQAAENSLVIDGVSLMPLLNKKTFVRNKPLYTFHHHGAAASLRNGDMCLVGFLNEKSPGSSRFRQEHYAFMKRASLTTFELYNLKDDPSQTNDIAEQYPGIVEELKLSMIRLYDETISEGVDWFQ
ncbi:MAG: sulfatase-like hydrolase/transferase [Bacteroidales bacterium]|nr:sulfatase-like hydrolase/transferase [Bacteroidales bacterium]